MKMKKITIQYPEMKLSAIMQSSKSGETIERLATASIDDLFKKTTSKDVQNFIKSIEDEEKMQEESSKVATPKPPSPVNSSAQQSSSNGGTNSVSPHSQNTPK